MAKKGFVIGDKADLNAWSSGRRAQLQWTRWNQAGMELGKWPHKQPFQFANTVAPADEKQGKLKGR